MDYLRRPTVAWRSDCADTSVRPQPALSCAVRHYNAVDYRQALNLSLLS